MQVINEKASNDSVGTIPVAMVKHRVLASEVLTAVGTWPTPLEVLFS